MILDLVGFISTHFQPKPSHGVPFQTNFWQNCQLYILLRTWFGDFWWFGFDLLDFWWFWQTQKNAERPYDRFPPIFVPRSLSCVRKQRFPFCEKDVLQLKTWERRSGRLPSANTSQKIVPFLNLGIDPWTFLQGLFFQRQKATFCWQLGIDPWTFPQGLLFPPKKQLFIKN